MRTIRFLVAHGHDVARLGIRTVIEAQPGWSVVGETGDGHAAVEQAAALRPDVVIVDLEIPGLNGLDAIQQIGQRVDARILAVFARASDQVESEIFNAGAHGYVLKANTVRHLVAAVRAVLLGKRFARDNVRPADAHAKRHSALTPRERDVLRLLADGLTNKEIAQVLRVSPKTTDTHRSRLMVKLGVHSIAELVRYAIRYGLADP